MPQLEVATIVMKDAVNVLIAKAADGPDKDKWVIPSDFINEFERTIDACTRSMKDKTGLTVIPKQVLFLSEIVEPPVDRRAVFCFAECASSGDPTPDASYSECLFVDPRDLGKYQKEGMSDLTADAFFKFSKILQAQASAMPRGGNV